VSPQAGGRKRVLGKNPDELNALWQKLKVTDDDIVMFSSSMDFPEDSTSNKAVLRMVQTVNGVFRATGSPPPQPPNEKGRKAKRKGQRR